jgi:hypothetical protein
MHEQGLEVKVELRQPRPRSYAGASVVSDGFNLPPRGAPCNLATTRQTHFTTLRPIPILSFLTAGLSIISLIHLSKPQEQHSHPSGPNYTHC